MCILYISTQQKTEKDLFLVHTIIFLFCVCVFSFLHEEASCVIFTFDKIKFVKAMSVACKLLVCRKEEALEDCAPTTHPPTHRTWLSLDLA